MRPTLAHQLVKVVGLGAEPVEVRLPDHLDGLDGLIIPGGESTAIGRLMKLYDLDDAVRGFDGTIEYSSAMHCAVSQPHWDGPAACHHEPWRLGNSSWKRSY